MSNVNRPLYEISHVTGQQLLTAVPANWQTQPTSGEYVRIPGTRGANGSSDIYISEETFSKHMLALGSIGSGKSTLLYHIVQGILGWRNPQNRYVFFDVKGDYIQHFWNANDCVSIGHDGVHRSDAWNLFADLMEDANSQPDCELLRQIATTLFKKQIESSNNPTFAYGARDLFVGLVRVFIHRHQREGNPSFTTMNNATLKQFFSEHVHDGEAIKRMIGELPDLAWLKTYLIAPQSATTQSYLAPLQTMMNDIFVGCFARAGTFSIRKFMRGQTSQRVLFLEYDPEKGCILDTVYTALLDLALKESIGRGNAQRHCFFILDEFPVVPALTYIGQILQLARSLGVKVIAAIQNTSQLTHKYGEAEALNILSGFSTVFAFRLFDEVSREVICNRHGKHLTRINCPSAQYGGEPLEEMRDLDVIADWDIVSLIPGQCIISPVRGNPFMFFPALYTAPAQLRPARSIAQPQTQPQPARRHTLTILSD